MHCGRVSCFTTEVMAYSIQLTSIVRIEYRLYAFTRQPRLSCKMATFILTKLYRAQGLRLTNEDVQVQLSRRRPGQSKLTTPVSSSRRFAHYNLITDNLPSA